MPITSSIAVAAVLLCSCASTAAAEWSDTSLSIGKRFGVPFDPLPIGKNIFALTHAGGAPEADVAVRHTLDIGELRGSGLAIGPIAGIGFTAGIDLSTNNDVRDNARTRTLLAGPTLMWKAPGFIHTSLLLLHESNAPMADLRGPTTYKMLTARWGVPLGLGFKFEGNANLIGARGRDEVGNQAGPETNIDMRLMYDLGAAMGSPKNLFRIGLQYQFWNNRFGNTSGSTDGRGQRVSTPMIRADVRF